jgi:hypothetical protein
MFCFTRTHMLPAVAAGIPQSSHELLALFSTVLQLDQRLACCPDIDLKRLYGDVGAVGAFVYLDTPVGGARTIHVANVGDAEVRVACVWIHGRSQPSPSLSCVGRSLRAPPFCTCDEYLALCSTDLFAQLHPRRWCWPAGVTYRRSCSPPSISQPWTRTAIRTRNGSLLLLAAAKFTRAVPVCGALESANRFVGPPYWPLAIAGAGFGILLLTLAAGTDRQHDCFSSRAHV